MESCATFVHHITCVLIFSPSTSSMAKLLIANEVRVGGLGGAKMESKHKRIMEKLEKINGKREGMEE